MSQAKVPTPTPKLLSPHCLKLLGELCVDGNKGTIDVPILLGQALWSFGESRTDALTQNIFGVFTHIINVCVSAIRDVVGTAISFGGILEYLLKRNLNCLEDKRELF
jgi:hypothetical protein